MGDATDGGAGTTGDAGAGTTTSTATTTTATGTQATGDGGKTAATQTAPKSFSQDDVDRIVSERVARATKPFADYEDVKQRAAEYDKLADAQKTELQRATDRAAESERRASQLETDLADNRLRSDVIATAAKMGIVDPVDAFKLLDRTKVEYDKAGDATNVAALLDDLVKAKPYLSGKPGNGSGEGGPRGGTTATGMTANEWFSKSVSGARR